MVEALRGTERRVIDCLAASGNVHSYERRPQHKQRRADELDSDVQSETFARLNVVLLSVKFFPGLKSSRRPVDPNLFKTVSSANVTWLLDHLVRSRQNARRNR